MSSHRATPQRQIRQQLQQQLQQQTAQPTHRDDPERPGWCAACGRAYPCPPTLTRAEARRLAIRFRDAR